jgi:aspartate aminotransferase
MTIARKMESFITKSSWIRKMFEDGARLKAAHGAANVFDFSLGNPNLPPPQAFSTALVETAQEDTAGVHGYMPNSGLPAAREAIADLVTRQQGTALSADDIIMTCGAAGALNVILKAVLDPGDEVITPAPFFVEYSFYADNHGGTLKPVPTARDFTLDLNAISDAIGQRTKVVLINSPNNPTGQVYSKESLRELGRILKERGKALNRTIYLVSDEPYRNIVYDGVDVPSLFSVYRETVIATSFSKDISIPGERLGYIALNPETAGRTALLDAMALANRILGFVNAPAFMQRVTTRVQNERVDVGAYDRKRKLLCDGLADCGYDFVRPAGAFYLFPRTPIADDVAFVRELQKELILTVPGSGFGGPGHFRIAFCVDDATITGSMSGFKRVMQAHQ